MKQRAVAIVQARVSSTRLPAKVLLEIGGRPALALLLERLGHARELDGIAVATSVEADDDPVADAAAAAGAQVVRGPLADVLERFRLAAEATAADAVVRITADCPLMDPAVVDLVVARWRRGGEDYVANIVDPRTFPDGLDVEVLSRAALEAAAAEAVDPVEREHVTPFVRRRPERFSHAGIWCEPDYGDVRATLDTPEDLELLRRVAAQIGLDGGMAELLTALGHSTAGIEYRCS